VCSFKNVVERKFYFSYISSKSGSNGRCDQTVSDHGDHLVFRLSQLSGHVDLGKRHRRENLLRHGHP
jgi:hypothetical protein